MIKRTLYFRNPSYLSVNLDQLIIKNPDKDTSSIVPIEDIGVVILDNPQITLTMHVLRKLQDNKVAIITCNKAHMPQGLLLPLEGNYTQSEIQRNQINASIPLKKQLWQQIIVSKISNQKIVLKKLNKPWKKLQVLESRVSSGDPENIEGQAANYYWNSLFENFNRSRFGDTPNNFLNYGYAILRSIVARALVSSGLLPSLGIFHKNKYNAFALADDMMEPYRPFVDLLVYNYAKSTESLDHLTKDAKQALLSIVTMDILLKKRKYPLMVGMSLTSKSLADCFAGSKRKLVLPVLP